MLNQGKGMANFNQMLQKIIDTQLSVTDMKTVFLRENDHSATIGPISRDGLKKFLDETDLPEHYEVKCGIDEAWNPIYSHPFFQRRKPQLISSVNFQKQNEIYILREGKKVGPYAIEDLKSDVKTKAILLTDEVSFDGGESWSKLYEVDEFDRRSLEQQPLPHSPEWDVFNESYNEVGESLTHKSEESVERDAIAGLAFFEKIKNGKLEQDQDKQISDLNFNTSEIIPQKSKMIANSFWAFLLVFSLFGTYNLLTDPSDGGLAKLKEEINKNEKVTKSSINNNIKSNRQPASAPVIHGAPIPRKRINNRVIQKPRSRKPQSRSFRSSDSFKNRFDERKMDDNAFRDIANEDTEEYPYDNDTDPVENDPVRSQVSKETLYPEDNYYDDADELEPNDAKEYQDDYQKEEVPFGEVISGKEAVAEPAEFDEEQEY